MLSLGIDYCLNGKLPTTSDDTSSKGKYLLLDMSPVRFKADRYLRHRNQNFSRVTGNIRDIHLSNLPIFHNPGNNHFVGIAKHLCGVATDYTIRCILNSMTDASFPLTVFFSCRVDVVQWGVYRDMLSSPLSVA